MNITQFLHDAFFPDAKLLTALGPWGDFIGGIWGTILTFLTFIVVLVTWFNSRSSEKLQRASIILAEMLKTHDNITSQGSSSFWGEGPPAQLLREFYRLYAVTRKIQPSYDVWNTDSRIDIAYTYAFYGLNSSAQDALSKYGEGDIKALQNEATRIRRGEEKYRFLGFQTSMSHYLRNMFAMYEMIDEYNLTRKDKLRLSKIIRAKLSNYEQAILVINIISHLGSEWEKMGLVDKYKPFSNVPKRFFSFDEKFDIKARFPTMIFEWEHHIEARTRYYKVKLFGWRILAAK